jgi:REP element-mobilizing transposase RayT
VVRDLLSLEGIGSPRKRASLRSLAASETLALPGASRLATLQKSFGGNYDRGLEESEHSFQKEGATVGHHGLAFAWVFAAFRWGGIAQTVTFRLFDSMPQTVLEQWRTELQHLPSEEFDRERRKRIDAYLDRGYGCCYLCEERLAKIVQEALLHFDGERYALHAWVVMPNHVHVLFTPKAGHEMSEIAHSWKSFTAHKCNKALQRSGEFWQHEPFDRFIRDDQHFANAVSYIENNPVNAGLCEKPEDWRWSSAWQEQ